MSEDKGKSKYYESLGGLATEDLLNVREDIETILQDRNEQMAVDKVAARAAEIVLDQLQEAGVVKPKKAKATKKKVATLKADDE